MKTNPAKNQRDHLQKRVLEIWDDMNELDRWIWICLGTYELVRVNAYLIIFETKNFILACLAIREWWVIEREWAQPVILGERRQLYKSNPQLGRREGDTLSLATRWGLFDSGTTP